MARLVALLALLLAGFAPLAAAQERVGVRTGNHPGFGRIVFDWTAAPAYTVETTPGRVLLRFPNPDAVVLPGRGRLPRNITAANRVEGGIELLIAEGSRVRHFRNGPKVAVDVMDAAAPEAAPPPVAAPAAAPRPAAPRPAAPRPAAPVATAPPAPRLAPNAAAPSPDMPAPTAAPAPAAPVAAAPVAAAPAEPASTIPSGAFVQPPPPAVEPPAPVAAAPPPAPTRPAPAAPVATATAPASPAAAVPAAPPARPAPLAPPVAEPASTANPPLNSLAGPPPIRARAVLRANQPSALRLPQAAGFGLAALRRGDSALVVLASERPLELGAVRADRAFAAAQVQRLPGASVLTFPLAADQRLVVERDGADWLLIPGPRAPGGPDVAHLRAVPEAESLLLTAPGAAQVVALTDAETGLPLLLGTLRDPLARQPVTRRLPEMELPETFHGAAILARSDRIALRAGAGRFVLTGAAPAPEVSPLTEGAGAMTRSFDFPAAPVPALMERLRAQQAAVASAAPLQRAPLRFAVAETLLSLGLPQEAQAMLRMAAEETPAAARDPRHRFLSGAAALLAGRTPPAGALEVEIPSSDEVMLWRALRDASRGETRTAAASLAATAPLFMSYPEGLRRRLLPVLAETLAAGGEGPAAARVLEQAGPDPSLALARALTENAQGRTEEALDLFDAAARSRDRLMRARALRHALERRLELGRVTPAEAAQGLEQTLFAWRGDAQEVVTRLRIADLRREAGDARAAMALLRETASLFPEQAAAIRPRLQQAFLQALETDAPLAAVAMHDAQPDLMPTGDAAAAVLEGLAGRLAALDLNDRAAALLTRALERTPAGEGRAALGARLAELRLDARDADAALEALTATSVRNLPVALARRRAILAARAEALRGQTERAVESLTALGAEGDLALSGILAAARDHAGAAIALARHLDRTDDTQALPAGAQREVLRLAALRILAGEEDQLPALRARYAARMTEAPLKAGFDALTSDPVRGLADLPRLARELDLFRSLPQDRG
ncbi:hypothetical protein [Roseococcus suduntuyensis]|uniref:Tetratricopeptide repeat-containing protein n=1 Tax=Roseococcus suduntuyensis TaxID=455361 RepID=A0A840AB18_9PROT|nr:hypothetical protein [Roseococcus suduntuyensis]MBB3899188.1 hypothetical protein [Roseococcus suduntuyensis]